MLHAPSHSFSPHAGLSYTDLYGSASAPAKPRLQSEWARSQALTPNLMVPPDVLKLSRLLRRSARHISL